MRLYLQYTFLAFLLFAVPVNGLESKNKHTLNADSYISMLLIGALDSTFGGKVVAQVESNVYASKGREIVIPAGSKAIGYYKSLTAEENLMISWTRIITPQGVNVPIKASSIHHEPNLRQATRTVIQSSQDIHFTKRN